MTTKKFWGILLALYILLSAKGLVFATDKIQEDSLKHYRFSQINIIESKSKVLDEIPGTAIIISSEQLSITNPISVSDIMKRYPGINISDEDGMGLRLNLGIRGLDPDRSRTLLVMEDGMPLALAPYGEPEMYYTPSIDRMHTIEVLKGSGSILYGPQTIGGVINFLTPEPPKQSKYSINFAGGSGGFLKSNIGYGTGSKNVGFMIEYLRKQADNFGPTHYQINDIMSKFNVVLDDRSNLSFKLNVYDEKSNSTYVGITQSMFDNGEHYVNIAPYDNLDIRRYSASISHNYAASNNIFINTIIYGYTTTRNWLRQDFSRSPHTNQTGAIFGDTTIKNGALYFLNSTAQRNRQFEVFGIEPRMTADYNLLGLKNETKAGIRFLYEKAYEQLVIGNKQQALSGQMRDYEIRTGNAISAYVQNRLFIGNDFIITPGLRIEKFDYGREINRTRNIDTLISASNSILGIIPGIGVNYNIDYTITAFAGIHRGFSPPRTKDAITAQGNALDLEAEDSWNYELGFRSQPISWLSLEITGYLLDFSNQIIPVSMSSGSTGTGLVNGGRTLHKGIESSFTFNLSNLFELPYSLVLQTNTTISESNYSSDRFVTQNDDRINVINYVLPYAPESRFSAILYFATNWGLELQVSANYVGEHFADELNTLLPSSDGQIGLINAHSLLDFNTKYRIPNTNLGIFFSIKNALDESYISSRRPQGIKVGMPRIITAGIDLNL